MHASLAAFDHFAALGYRPIACVGKRPKNNGWQAGNTAAERLTVEPGDNIGLVCGFDGLVALDFDISNPELVEHILALPELQSVPVRIGRAPRCLMPFRSELPVPSRDWNYEGLPKGDKVQIIAKGRQFIAWGIHPDTGQPYTWLRGPLPALAQLPVHEVDA